MCPLKVDLLSVTFDPKTAEIRLLIVTHPFLRCNHHRCDMSSYYCRPGG